MSDGETKEFCCHLRATKALMWSPLCPWHSLSLSHWHPQWVQESTEISSQCRRDESDAMAKSTMSRWRGWESVTVTTQSSPSRWNERAVIQCSCPRTLHNLIEIVKGAPTRTLHRHLLTRPWQTRSQCHRRTPPSPPPSHRPLIHHTTNTSQNCLEPSTDSRTHQGPQCHSDNESNRQRFNPIIAFIA